MMNIKKIIGLTLPLSLIFLSPSLAITNSINVQTFNPSTSDHFVVLEDGFKSEWPKTAKMYFGANYNYVTNPLVALNSTQSAKIYNIIDSIQTFDLFFGFKPANNFGLFLGAPIHSVNFSNSAATPAVFRRGSATAFGDMKILAKIRLTDDAAPTSVALIPEFHLPTGSTENFVSDASTYIGARLAVERQFESWTLLGNLGFAAASNAIYIDSTYPQGIDYRKRLIVGVGGFMPFSDQVGMNVEINSISMIPFDKTLNPNDAYLGIRVAANDSLVLTGGGSISQIGGAGGQDFRAIAGLRYTLFDDTAQAPRPISLNTTPNQASGSTPPRAILQAKRIEILSPINFENNSYTLLPDSKQTLDEVAELLIKNKASYKKVQIDGHTSDIGTDEYNLNLSLSRSKAVKAYLVSKGVPITSLEARGFGFRSPKVSKTDPNATEINRRVEFIFVK